MLKRGEEHRRSMAQRVIRANAEFLLSFFTRYYDCIYHRRRLKIGSQMLLSSCALARRHFSIQFFFSPFKEEQKISL